MSLPLHVSGGFRMAEKIGRSMEGPPVKDRCLSPSSNERTGMSEITETLVGDICSRLAPCPLNAGNLTASQTRSHNVRKES